jgi:ADP-heptose:LPS heptosyltransferase
MEHCGVQMPDEEKKPIYTITDAEREAAAKETNGRVFLGVQLRANSPDRNWQPGNQLRQDKNYAVINQWLEKYPDIDVMIFDQHESFAGKLKKHPRIFVCAGKSIRETMALLERCVMTFTLNSGMLVASGALGVPQVSLFGNINPSARVPYLPNVRPIWHPELCVHGKAPCWSTCGHAYCLDRITVEEVVNNLEELFEGPGRERHELMKERMVKKHAEPVPSMA